MSESIQEIAYDVALRAIARQSDVLGSLRSRAATLVAAAALVTSVLGGPALETDANGHFDVAGAVALGGALALALAILLPWRLTFRLSATIILEDHAETATPTPVPELQAFLARTLERHHDANEMVLRRLNFAFQGASVLLAVEAVAWIGGV